MTDGPLDLGEIRRIHKSFESRQARMLDEVMNEIGIYACESAEKFPQFTPRSSPGLRDANEHQVIRTTSGRLLRLRNRTKYAMAIDKGAAPHPIYPRKPGGLLKFYWPRVGHWVALRKVNHPGNKPYRFLEKAASAAYFAGMKKLQHEMGSLSKRF